LERRRRRRRSRRRRRRFFAEIMRNATFYTCCNWQL
jgi:hypothetical protein